MTTTAPYQEIFAEFVEGATQALVQWYSIKPLHNSILSLADLLEVLAENMQMVLKNAAGLGKLTKHGTLFSFLPTKFDSFCAAFMIQDACEYTRRRVSRSSVRFEIVRDCLRLSEVTLRYSKIPGWLD
jgi:hypothetical protein